MEKEKLITEIDLTLESIRAHIKRIKNDSNNVHKMDMDLLIEKTRNVYDKLIRLDGLTILFETEIPQQLEPEIEETETEEAVVVKVEEIVKEEANAEEKAEIMEEDAKVEVHEEEIVDEVKEQI